MANFSVWVDADSCPKMVREHLISFSSKKQVPVIFVANRPIPNQTKSDFFSMIICDTSSQAADDYIFSHAGQYDMVITRDIPFAARMIEKNICTINDRGTTFNRENIREKLSERDFSLNLAQLGLAGGGKNTYGQKEFKKFADCFEREIQKLLIIDQYGPPKSAD